MNICIDFAKHAKEYIMYISFHAMEYIDFAQRAKEHIEFAQYAKEHLEFAQPIKIYIEFAQHARKYKYTEFANLQGDI